MVTKPSHIAQRFFFYDWMQDSLTSTDSEEKQVTSAAESMAHLPYTDAQDEVITTRLMLEILFTDAVRGKETQQNSGGRDFHSSC